MLAVDEFQNREALLVLTGACEVFETGRWGCDCAVPPGVLAQQEPTDNTTRLQSVPLLTTGQFQGVTGMSLTFRHADETDLGLVLEFIKELAEYERLLDDVVATEDTLREWMFEKKAAGAFFAVVDGAEVGFCVFYYNFSSFVGRAGVFIEDIYVKPEYRGRGYGKAMMKKIASIAIERGCGRIEWSCLDWNEPSIRFYLSLGAQPMDEWTVYRMAGETLNDMAAE